MSQFVIYIKLEKYLSQWVTHHFGVPAVFPAQSNVNAVIRTFLTRMPEGVTPDLNNGDDTVIAIPDSKAKPPQTYNYIRRRGKIAVKEVLRDLFKRSLWTDISPLDNTNVGLNTRIAAWCEMQGISFEYVETVRQCYYRMRDSYADRDINLRCSSRKK